MIETILLIIGVLLTIRMINAAFRLGQRATVASETTALHMAALYNALTPEARARAEAAFARTLEVNADAERNKNKRRVDVASTF